MMRKMITLLLVCASTISIAQIQLSDNAEIYAVTCGPWAGQLYTAFGHNAIRVKDDSLGIDLAYNYGVFSFNQPNFYLNYTRGYLYYQLGVYRYDDFHYEYEYFNRYVHEQRINLTAGQKQKVFDYLFRNAQPENTMYLYDYFYNNCATKVRDVFAEALAGEVKFDGSYIKSKYTIRQLTGLYLKDQPWGRLGIDICLGLPMDKVASPYEYMYLPEYIESGFNHATINGQPLVAETTITNEAGEQSRGQVVPHPWIVFGSFLALTFLITALDWQKRRISRWFDLALFTVTGLIGLLLLLLWIATDHKAAASNFNLWWALPSHLCVWALLRKNVANWVLRYFRFVAVLLGLLLVVWWFLPQQLNAYLVPFVAAMLLRAFTIQHPRFLKAAH
jgi:hypothetical protein